MIESAHVFGRYDHLLGVCTAPQKESSTRATGVLMLTAGMLHHVGPFGLHVSLARRLSEIGFYSLRFCLSGIGESLGVASAGSSTQRAVDEAGQAMDWLQATHGIDRFVTFGLCSGADDSVNVALADKRVVGTVLMDGCGYRTPGFVLRKYLLQQPRKLFHRLMGIPHGASIFGSHSASEIGSTLAAGEDIREFPDRETAAQEFQSLVDRGVRMLLLYTGGVADYFNGAAQFGEMFPKLRSHERIDLRYYPTMDHVAKLAEDRNQVVDVVAKWMTHWPEILPPITPEPTTMDRNQEACHFPTLATKELSGSAGFPVTLP